MLPAETTASHETRSCMADLRRRPLSRDAPSCNTEQAMLPPLSKTSKISFTWDRQQGVACCDMDPSPSRNSDIRNLTQMRWSFEPTVACPISTGGSGNGRCASTSGQLELTASDLHTGSFAVHRARRRTGAPRKGENLQAEALATRIGRP